MLEKIFFHPDFDPATVADDAFAGRDNKLSDVRATAGRNLEVRGGCIPVSTGLRRADKPRLFCQN
jgi:hypothetical protein